MHKACSVFFIISCVLAVLAGLSLIVSVILGAWVSAIVLAVSLFVDLVCAWAFLQLAHDAY